jgi:hypothetical protein
VSGGTGKAGAGPETGTPRRPGHDENKAWKLALAGLVGGYLALSCYGLVTAYQSHVGQTSGVSASRAISATRIRASDGTSSGAESSLSPRTGGGSPSPRARRAVPRPLPVLSIVAFGPDGTSDGDNQGVVYRILDANTGQPWYSQWYTTPEFGNLRSGTGLMLDLGETMNVRDVRLLLGSQPGADIQVRVGNSLSANLPAAASLPGAPGGAVRLTTGTASGRYVLIWFTLLPPDGQGHYQISVYNITVDGTRFSSAG